MADIFLSYSREDQEHAKVFARALEAAGFSVWWDVRLRSGDAYDEVTERALREAKSVVVLWSKRSAASQWVRAEATLAQRSKTLFPCMIEPCERPIMFELTQTADLSHWRGAENDPVWTVFVDDLRTFIAGERKEDAAADAARLGARRASNVQKFSFSRRTAVTAGGAVALAAIAAGIGVTLTRSPSLMKNGLAVLPFRNLSGDKTRDYLSAGLAAEIRTVLARNAGLRVVAQASSEAIKARAIGAAEMARALSVTYLLDGNLSLDGDRLRIATDIIDGRTGFSQWSKSFDVPMTELSLVQDEIASAVSRELSVDAETGAPPSSYGMTGNSEAFDDYLMGNSLYARAANNADDLEALARFDRSIARDPNFGAAHAARARSLTSLGNTADNIVRARLYYESAVEAARRAVALGPASADAFSTLGFVLFQSQLKVAEAREPYEKSHALGKGAASILARYAGFAAATRRETDAREAATSARNLDPLNATIHRAVGFVHYAAGRYDASIEAVETALSLNPDLSDSHARIAMANWALNRPDAALIAAEKERSAMMRFPALSIIRRRLGDDAGAEEAFAALVSTFGDAGLYQQAQTLAAWDRADAAMATLEKALSVGDSGLTYAYIDPTLARLREREDFKRLLSALGFIESHNRTP